MQVDPIKPELKARMVSTLETTRKLWRTAFKLCFQIRPAPLHQGADRLHRGRQPAEAGPVLAGPAHPRGGEHPLLRGPPGLHSHLGVELCGRDLPVPVHNFPVHLIWVHRTSNAVDRLLPQCTDDVSKLRGMVCCSAAVVPRELAQDSALTTSLNTSNALQ